VESGGLEGNKNEAGSEGPELITHGGLHIKSSSNQKIARSVTPISNPSGMSGNIPTPSSSATLFDLS